MCSNKFLFFPKFLDWRWESKRSGITGQCYNCGRSRIGTVPQQTKCVSG